MSIEANIERIAVATEKLVTLLTVTTTESKAVVEVVAVEPKKRGRPAKVAEPAKPAAEVKEEFDDGPEPVAAEPEPEVTEPVATSSSQDDFLDDTPAEKAVTIEEVRAALKAFSDRNDTPAGSGRTRAQALLKTKTGFDTLGDLKAKGDPKTYKSVVDAASA
jgi:hypothetical protein